MSESGRVSLSDVREWSLQCLGVFGRPSRMSRSSGEALPDVWELSGGPPESLGGNPGSSGGQLAGPEMVGTHSRMSLRSGRPFRMSGSGWETLPNVREGWEALPDVQEALQMSGSV